MNRHGARENDTVRVTEAEWQAVFLGSRSLRAVAADFLRVGAHELAAEHEGHAAALEALGRRSVVVAARDEAVAERDQPEAVMDVGAMSHRELSEISEAAPGLPCAFTDNRPCARPATTYVEWDTGGSRQREAYCDEHAAHELAAQGAER